MKCLYKGLYFIFPKTDKYINILLVSNQQVYNKTSIEITLNTTLNLLTLPTLSRKYVTKLIY